MLEHRIYPVLYTSGLGNIGADRVLDFISEFMPEATEHPEVKGGSTRQRLQPAVHHVVDTEPPPSTASRPSTIRSPDASRYFKVFSGVTKNDATLQNFTRSTSEKFAHLSIAQGKQHGSGQRAARRRHRRVAKLRETLTGDTLGDKAAPITYPSVTLPEPAITFAIEPKSRADEDKLSNGIHKLMEEDPMLRFFRDEQTKEFLIAGTGQQHIEVIVSKLKKRYHTEVMLKAPKVPYRETIRGRADAHGRHKKQSGGHGQFGDCKIKMEPLPRGGNFEFVNDIFGGSIPKNFIPAVEKGIVEAAARGYLAGFPVVDFKVILYDGSYHDVDSNELSFKTAGRIAFKKAMEQAKPTLLEPIMKVEITAPDEFAGIHHGRSQLAARPHSGHGQQGRQDHRQGRSTDVRNADLRRGTDVDDAGPRHLHHGNGPLRHRSPAAAGKDRHCRESRARRSRSRKKSRNNFAVFGLTRAACGSPYLLCNRERRER